MRNDVAFHEATNYHDLVEGLARAYVRAGRWGRRRTPDDVRILYEGLGRAAAFDRTPAEALVDVAARAHQVNRGLVAALDRKVFEANKLRRRAEVYLHDKLSRVLDEPRYLARLPALRASLGRPGAARVPARVSGRPPAASIVILSHDRVDYLETTLAAFHETIDFDDYELIIVDNGSTDGSRDFLRRVAAREQATKVILRRNNHGIAPGYNVGFAYAEPRTGCYVKLDSDVVPLSRGWLPRVLRILRGRPTIGALSMFVVNHAVLHTSRVEDIDGERLRSWHWWVAGGGGMTIPRHVFDRFGYFFEDERYAYHSDDGDYYARLMRAGYQAYYVDALRAFHRTDLDAEKYSSYTKSKREQRAARLNVDQDPGRPYDRRSRPLEQLYAHYQGCSFPQGVRLIEID